MYVCVFCIEEHDAEGAGSTGLGFEALRRRGVLRQSWRRRLH